MGPALALKTVAFLLVVPGVVGVALPVAVARWSPGDLPLALGPIRYLGALLMATGGAVYLWCAVDLSARGHGIPAPLEPTRYLVRSGLYRHLRNPMYAAGSAFLYGEGILLQRGSLLLYAAAVSLLQHLGVVLMEEPALRKRFGESYDEYRSRVPRWLPRLRSYHP